MAAIDAQERSSPEMLCPDSREIRTDDKVRAWGQSIPDEDDLGENDLASFATFRKSKIVSSDSLQLVQEYPHAALPALHGRLTFAVASIKETTDFPVSLWLRCRLRAVLAVSDGMTFVLGENP
jgi:hypothetical protein